MAPKTTIFAAPPDKDAAGPAGPLVNNNTARNWWQDAGLRRLNAHCLVLLLGSFVCGFDGSIMNGFFGIASFLEDTDNPDPNKQGLLTAAISLGYLIGFVPSSWAADRFGRRLPQLFGAIVIVAAVFMQVFALGGWNFFGARLLLGFGAAFPLTAGSAHLFELAHPRQAAEMATLFAAFYWVGAIVAAWSTFGCTYMSSNWAWRLPALLQGLASLIQAIFLWWVPESPRWLCAQGRTEEAHAILAKYHAGGDYEDELVLSELAEIRTALEIEKTSAFGYLDFFKTPANRYRLFLCVFIGFSTQMLGNTIVSYYLVPILTSVGYTSVPQQQGINGGHVPAHSPTRLLPRFRLIPCSPLSSHSLQIMNLVVSLVAVVYCQKLSRRFMWLFSTIGVLVTYSMLTAASAVYAKNESTAAGQAAVAMIFLYSAVYDVAWSIMYYSYTLEILPFHMRTKGMAISLVVDYAALFFAQYANPPAFNAIGWKYYCVYIAYIAIVAVIVYLYFPETAGLTLEQSAILLDGDTAQAKIDEAVKHATATAKKDDEIEV
ncbi:hypothetical protein JCM10207_003258 [Rhodosporidiobolus poonsookiae]